MKLIYSLVGLLLIAIVVFDRFTIERLTQELAMAHNQVSQLNQANTFTSKRNPIKYIKRDKDRVKVFGFLYEINKDKKRIKYLPGELIVEDLALSQNDRFLDLLDFLFEQELLVMIEIPENKTVNNDLRLAGFSSDYITHSKDGVWRIKIKE